MVQTIGAAEKAGARQQRAGTLWQSSRAAASRVLPRTSVIATARVLTAAAFGARTTIYLVCQARETMPAPVWCCALALEFAVLCAVVVKIALSLVRADRAPSSDEAENRLGAYTLGEKIGQGGMGVVYKAHHAMLQRPAAIKLLPRERATDRDLERFEREVQLTSKLTHPNTVSVYDFGRTRKGSFYYAMEYLDGLDLEALVERDGPQPPARVAHVLAQVCGALAEAHTVGLLHRDIKPANVILCERGGMRDVVKVVDFGLVKEMGSVNENAPRTEANSIVGTPMYIAPEAMTAPEQMDGRSDLYAVGALGYFLLTGKPPFSGKSVLEVCYQHLHAEAVPPSRCVDGSIPAALEQLILSCLAKSPDRRPRDAASLQQALLPLAAAWSQDAAAALEGGFFAGESAPGQLDSQTASRSDVRAILGQAA